MKVFEEYITIQDLKAMQKIINDHHHREELDKILELEDFEMNFYKMKLKDLKNDFIQMLDECYKPIKINGIFYPYSVAFEKMDSVAFEIAFYDYVADIMEKYE